MRKTTQLRRLVQRPELDFLMEAHNGISARLVEEAGFEGIWASGFTMSASLGVRDCNEASWTQVLEMLEFMSDATSIPILQDADTGYGNFNAMRRLVRKLEQRGIAGVCIEDKVFPKTNSFLRSTTQPLADMHEFAGKIKAGKDAQSDPDFVIVARVEALIAGWGLDEALRRAEAYHEAGADAILIHSALHTAREVLAFKREWGDRLPVIIVPTKYYATPTEVFRDHGFSIVIWANHLLRSAVAAMRTTARQVFTDQNLLDVEDRIVDMPDIFRLQGEDELEQAERSYLPGTARDARAIILAASRGDELGDLTAALPKCMVSIAGRPLLSHIVDTYRAAGIRTISVVRGYQKQAVDIEGVRTFDNEEHATTQEVYSLWQARDALQGDCIVSYGDVLFKKYILQELLECDADVAIAVDVNWRESSNTGRQADFVRCSEPSTRASFYHPVHLVEFLSGSQDDVHGEWMGFARFSPRGTTLLQQVLAELATQPGRLRQMKMPELLQRLSDEGQAVRVIYTTGHWIDVDSVDDVVQGASFERQSRRAPRSPAPEPAAP